MRAVCQPVRLLRGSSCKQHTLCLKGCKGTQTCTHNREIEESTTRKGIMANTTCTIDVMTKIAECFVDGVMMKYIPEDEVEECEEE